jgi:hypothetical protein
MAYEDRNIIYDDNINGSAEFLYEQLAGTYLY